MICLTRLQAVRLCNRSSVASAFAICSQRRSMFMINRIYPSSASNDSRTAAMSTSIRPGIESISAFSAPVIFGRLRVSLIRLFRRGTAYMHVTIFLAIETRWRSFGFTPGVWRHYLASCHVKTSLR
jgi:hypothetical protein